MEKIILTREIIDKGRSSRGGWNREQGKALGVTNFVKGWMNNIIGKEIDKTFVDHFLSLTDFHLKNKIKLKPIKTFQITFEPVSINTTYKDQYKHPNWQKKRLIILNRDRFICIDCNCANKMLHVHHLKYNRTGFIWEVPDWYLVTLCEDCHSKEHNRDLTSKY